MPIHTEVTVRASTPRAGEAPLCICYIHLIVLDATHLSRASAEAVRAVVTAETPPPVVAITPHRGVRHRVGGAHYVIAYLADDGTFADSAQVLRDILSTWSCVRPLRGPGGLRVDRVAQRATVRDRELTLRPFDFRLVRALAERGARGCSIDELRAAAWNGRSISSRRAVIAVRQGLERLRTLFRRTELTLISGSDGDYRLTASHRGAGDRPA